jgi:hypothetical protein
MIAQRFWCQKCGKVMDSTKGVVKSSDVYQTVSCLDCKITIRIKTSWIGYEFVPESGTLYTGKFPLT